MDYTIQELIHNQSFRRMVKGVADTGEVSRWNRWIEASDEHRRKAKQATAEISGFEFKDPEFPDVGTEWNKLRKDTMPQRSMKLPLSYHGRDAITWTYRVAAVLLVIALTGIGYYFHLQPNQTLTHVKQITRAKTIKTGPNEQTTIDFSSGAKIILHSHSTLTYQLGMLHRQTIKIELRGEAYFEAVKGESEFVVHTPDGVIRDIGTKFLVAVKKSYSRVVVQDGRVEIDVKGKNKGGQTTTVKKGKMVSFDQSHVLSKKAVNPTYYTSWATGFMQFHQTSLQKFAGFVEKRFNVDVKIVDPKLEEIKISGSIYFKSLVGLIKSVSKVAMIHAYRSEDGKTVYLGNRHNEKINSYE